MVKVFYSYTHLQLSKESWDSYFYKLPISVQESIAKFKKWQDRQNALIGKHQLLKGLEIFNIDIEYIHQLKFNEFQKPYIEQPIDFNISHTNGMVMCAISDEGEIGIDVEKKQEIDISLFKKIMNEYEWNDINKSENKNHDFLTLWAKKEAIIKAEGKGLSIPLNEINVFDNPITYQNNNWFLKKIHIKNDYISYLAHKNKDATIEIEEIKF